VSRQQLILRHYGGQGVGRESSQIARHAVHFEASVSGLSYPMPDLVDVAIVDIDFDPIDYQPCSAVHDPAPVSGSGGGTFDVGNALRVELTVIVETEIPVSIRELRSLEPRTPQGNRNDVRKRRKVVDQRRDRLREFGLVHGLQTYTSSDLCRGTQTGRGGTPSYLRPNAVRSARRDHGGILGR